MASATIKKRKGKSPLIVPPPGPYKRRPKGKKKTGSLPVTAVDRKTGKKDLVATKKIKKSNKLLERTYPSEMTGMGGGLQSPIRRGVNDLIRQFVSDEDARTMRTTRKVADHPRMQEKGLTGSRSKPLDAPRKHGGGMSHAGLDPAEEKHQGKTKATGTVSEATREENIKREAKGGGKVYRKLGGKVTNGNDVVRMIYEGDN